MYSWRRWDWLCRNQPRNWPDLGLNSKQPTPPLLLLLRLIRYVRCYYCYATRSPAVARESRPYRLRPKPSVLTSNHEEKSDFSEVTPFYARNAALDSCNQRWYIKHRLVRRYKKSSIVNNQRDAIFANFFSRYSLCSSCCSTDLQSHSRSMILVSFESQHATFY